MQKRLIASGIYNMDGSVNMMTAERMGWAQQWREAEEAAKGCRRRGAAAALARGRGKRHPLDPAEQSHRWPDFRPAFFFPCRDPGAGANRLGDRGSMARIECRGSFPPLTQ
jgi:hypothetical protein